MDNDIYRQTYKKLTTIIREKYKSLIDSQFKNKFILIDSMLLSSEEHDIIYNIINDIYSSLSENDKYNIIKYKFNYYDDYIEIINDIRKKIAIEKINDNVYDVYEENTFNNIIEYTRSMIINKNKNSINLITYLNDCNFGNIENISIEAKFSNISTINNLIDIVDSAYDFQYRFIESIILKLIINIIGHNFLKNDLYKAHVDLSNFIIKNYKYDKIIKQLLKKLNIIYGKVRIFYDGFVELYVSNKILTIDEIKNLKNTLILIFNKIESYSNLLFDDFEYTNIIEYIDKSLYNNDDKLNSIKCSISDKYKFDKSDAYLLEFTDEIIDNLMLSTYNSLNINFVKKFLYVCNSAMPVFKFNNSFELNEFNQRIISKLSKLIYNKILYNKYLAIDLENQTFCSKILIDQSTITYKECLISSLFDSNKYKNYYDAFMKLYDVLIKIISATDMTYTDHEASFNNLYLNKLIYKDLEYLDKNIKKDYDGIIYIYNLIQIYKLPDDKLILSIPFVSKYDNSHSSYNVDLEKLMCKKFNYHIIYTNAKSAKYYNLHKYYNLDTLIFNNEIFGTMITRRLYELYAACCDTYIKNDQYLQNQISAYNILKSINDNIDTTYNIISTKIINSKNDTKIMIFNNGISGLSDETCNRIKNVAKLLKNDINDILSLLNINTGGAIND